MKRGGGRSADPELSLELTDGKAGERGLDEEGGDAALAPAAVDRREERDDRRLAPVRHPELDAIQDVAVALADGARRDRRGVGAGSGLGERECRRDLARCEPWQITPLLLVGARRDDRPASRVLDEIDGRGGGAGPGDLLDGEAERQGAHVRSAVGFGDVEPHEPLVAQELQRFVRVDLGLVDMGGQWRDPVAGDGAHQLAHLALLGRQIEVVARHRIQCIARLGYWAPPRDRLRRAPRSSAPLGRRGPRPATACGAHHHHGLAGAQGWRRLTLLVTLAYEFL